MKIENSMNASGFRLSVLGTRGSMPGEGKEFALFGGSTSCYRVRAGQEEIYLDAGSGIAGAKPETETNITVLLTHMHLDHLIGLPFFPALTNRDRAVDIYAAERAGLSPQDGIDRLVDLPFWPCRIGDYPANVKFHTLTHMDDTRKTASFQIGDVRVDRMEGTHPGGSTIYRLTFQGKSIVYATDFEHEPADGCEALIDFAKGCDLLLYDAQYTEDEYGKYRGYGHSTPDAGLEIAIAANAAKLLLVHHAPWRRDDELLEMERAVRKNHADVIFAKIGDEFSI